MSMWVIFQNKISSFIRLFSKYDKCGEITPRNKYEQVFNNNINIKI